MSDSMMTKMRISLVAIALTLSPSCLGLDMSASFDRKEIPAFPGAEGFGAATPGGRGGRVIFVTNLADDGPGSFRAACEAEGPRIGIFRIAGPITLATKLIVKNPFIT